ncbi:hypothetical protein CRUP_028878 [Coryphaenoides rupestris]|nr:hypothetical protein CRUP_028878 [Coryphaenoides rupestris]
MAEMTRTTLTGSQPRDWNVFEIVHRPLPTVSKGTHVIVPLVDQLRDDRWEAKIVERDGTALRLSVNSAAKAPVGQYALSVTTGTGKEGDKVAVYEADRDVVVLFNPWCILSLAASKGRLSSRRIWKVCPRRRISRSPWGSTLGGSGSGVGVAGVSTSTLSEVSAFRLQQHGQSFRNQRRQPPPSPAPASFLLLLLSSGLIVTSTRVGGAAPGKRPTSDAPLTIRRSPGILGAQVGGGTNGVRGGEIKRS